MKKVFAIGVGSVLLATVIFVSCTKDEAASKGAAVKKSKSGDKAGPKVAKGQLYAANLSGTLIQGKEGKLVLQITPGKGYKLNLEFDAEVTLSGNDALKLTQEKYAQKQGQMDSKESGSKIVLAATGIKSGKATIDANLSISVCNDNFCHFLRDRKHKFSVQIK